MMNKEAHWLKVNVLSYNNRNPYILFQNITKCLVSIYNQSLDTTPYLLTQIAIHKTIRGGITWE